MTTETVPAGLIRMQHGRVYLNDEHAWKRYVARLHKARGKGNHTEIPTVYPCLVKTDIGQSHFAGMVFRHTFYTREDIEAKMARCKIWLQRFYDPTTLVNGSTGT